MKKISLRNLNLKEVEKLSREQLKNVLGGFTGLTEDVTYAEHDGRYKCCPKGDPTSSQCSECVEADSGDMVSCELGTVYPC